MGRPRKVVNKEEKPLQLPVGLKECVQPTEGEEYVDTETNIRYKYVDGNWVSLGKPWRNSAGTCRAED